MNKQEIYALLSARNIWHEVTEHKAVFNMAEVAEIHLPYPPQLRGGGPGGGRRPVQRTPGRTLERRY